MSLPGRLSWVHSVLPFCPRLPLTSAARTATADGSSPRTRPSELPALAWSLELLRRWEVRGTKPQQPASLGSGPVYLCSWSFPLPFHPRIALFVCLSVSMSPGAWTLSISLGWVCPQDSLFLWVLPVFLEFLFSQAVNMFSNSNSRMQFVPVLRLHKCSPFQGMGQIEDIYVFCDLSSGGSV